MMGSSFPPYRPPPPVEYLFIDGASLTEYLKSISKEYFDGIDFSLDLTHVRGDCTKIFYYDALPVRTEGENDSDYKERILPRIELHKRLNLTDRVHVCEGDARKRRHRGQEQKMVDVMLAVDMLTHCFRGNMQRATLLTGDQDFTPLIDALVLEGMFVTLWYPVGQTSSELISAADRCLPMSLQDLSFLLTPESKLRFALPTFTNEPADVGLGELRAQWSEDGGLRQIYKNQMDWIVVFEINYLNRHCYRHCNGALLARFIREQSQSEIPKEYKSLLCNDIV